MSLLEWQHKFVKVFLSVVLDKLHFAQMEQLWNATASKLLFVSATRLILSSKFTILCYSIQDWHPSPSTHSPHRKFLAFIAIIDCIRKLHTANEPPLIGGEWGRGDLQSISLQVLRYKNCGPNSILLPQSTPCASCKSNADVSSVAWVSTQVDKTTHWGNQIVNNESAYALTHFWDITTNKVMSTSDNWCNLSRQTEVPHIKVLQIRKCLKMWV